MELEWIQYLRQVVPNHPMVDIGVGDDAAVLETGPYTKIVVAVDMVADGVDFRLAEIDPALAGRKALAVNLSDIAAMACRPIAAVIAAAFPKNKSMEVAKRVYEGVWPLASEYGVAIIGGDTQTWDGPLTLAVTVLGLLGPKGPITRAGARPGDDLLATGEFGGSILGKHLHFQPRVREALLLAESAVIHAAIDVSDGLALDLWRLASESGCGAELFLEEIPIAEDAFRLSERNPKGGSPLEHALYDGEDFELLLALPPAEAERVLSSSVVDCPLRRIGRLVAEKGFWACRRDGSRAPLEPRGYLH